MSQITFLPEAAPSFSGLLMVVLVLVVLTSRGGLKNRHLRGGQMLAVWTVWWRLRSLQFDPGTFRFGRYLLPETLANNHILVAGTSGSGKTVLLRLLMQSVFPRICPGSGQRALIYDGKRELLEVVEGMNLPHLSVFTFDPFDASGIRWDIARDVTDPAAANQVARLLFPKQEGEHQPFFPESVQNLSACIMEALHERAAGKWRLSHLLYILRSTERIKETLKLTEKGRDTLSQFVHSGETWGNITASISNRIRDYEIVAALWDEADEAISMKQWNESESVLVIRKNQNCEAVVDAINRVILGMARRQLLSKPEDPNRGTWVILDELASIGGKPAAKELNLLLEQGRSRNIRVALGLQNIASLRDEFGQYGADRLIALCSTKAMLRFEDQSSAEWAAGFFGKAEVRVESTTRSHMGANTVSFQDRDRWTVMPSEFLAIPSAGPRHGLTGYFSLPDGRRPLMFRDRLRPRWLFGRMLLPVSQEVRSERTEEAMACQVTESDYRALLQLPPRAVVETMTEEEGTVLEETDDEEVAAPEEQEREVYDEVVWEADDEETDRDGTGAMDEETAVEWGDASETVPWMPENTPRLSTETPSEDAPAYASKAGVATSERSDRWARGGDGVVTPVPEEAQQVSVPLYDLQKMAMATVDLWSLEPDDV